MYYRKDSIIQDAMGHALAGAHLYVCEQPANLTIVPPAPLAQVWADAEGRSGILPFPLIADGTGHFYYYAESDIYTEVYFFRGQLYRIMPDQGVGCYCGTGGGDGPVPWTFALQSDNVFGQPNPDVPVLLYTAFTQQVFPANFSSPPSYGTCGINPAAPAIYTVELNGVAVGTVQIDTNGLFTFSSPGFLMNPRDRLEVMPPDPPDLTLSGVALSLVGTRIT